jgi:hypothetical protein
LRRALFEEGLLDLSLNLDEAHYVDKSLLGCLSPLPLFYFCNNSDS